MGDLRRRRPRGCRARGRDDVLAPPGDRAAREQRGRSRRGGTSSSCPRSDRDDHADRTTWATSGACARSCRRWRRRRLPTSSTWSRSQGPSRPARRSLHRFEARAARVLARRPAASCAPGGIRVHTVLPRLRRDHRLSAAEPLPEPLHAGARCGARARGRADPAQRSNATARSFSSRAGIASRRWRRRSCPGSSRGSARAGSVPPATDPGPSSALENAQDLPVVGKASCVSLGEDQPPAARTSN